jgi:error-prone DNA polymerase
MAERAGLDRADLEALAAAGALATLAGHRHRAAWRVTGVERPLPLLPALRIPEGLPLLRAPREGEDIVADYRALGLTLGRHPLALLRARLAGRGWLTASELWKRPDGARVRTGGIVVTRQRPGSTSGVTFVTVEDETGQANLIVWKSLGDRQRRVLLGARLLGVSGVVQREGDVLHVVARRLEDLSAMLGELDSRSRDFR